MSHRSHRFKVSYRFKQTPVSDLYYKLPLFSLQTSKVNSRRRLFNKHLKYEDEETEEKIANEKQNGSKTTNQTLVWVDDWLACVSTRV